MNRVVLLNYTGSESNWGCKATSSNLLCLINKGKDISLELIPIEYNGSFYRRLLNKIRLMCSVLFVHQAFVYLFSTTFKYLHPLEFENIKKICDCDILVLNGEGSLHGMTQELIKFVQYLSYAKKLGKRVYTVNQSLHFDNKKAKRYLKELYRYSDLNYFREPMSLDNSNLLNIKNAHLVPDAAFLNYSINTDKIGDNFNLPSKYILASGSILLTEDSQSFFSFIDKLKSHYKYTVVFLASCEADKALENVVKDYYQYDYYDNDDLDFRQVQKIIKESEFFISGRFHMNIFAACAGKIFIPFISNTKKMEGLVNLLDYPINPLDLNILDIEKEFEHVKTIISERQVLERHISNKSKILVENVESHYESIF